MSNPAGACLARPRARSRIILHELARVVGLGHTREEASLMYPDAAQQTKRPTAFLKSEMTGLSYLGRDAGCISLRRCRRVAAARTRRRARYCST